MKCFMRYLVRVIDIIPKDLSKNVNLNMNRIKMFHVKPKIHISNEFDLECGLWLIFFK
jgi:hypothetical protein